MSAAVVPGTTDSWVNDGWAYVANFEGITTVDLRNPSTPVIGDHAPGGGDSRDNRDVKVAEPEDAEEYDLIAGLANNAGNLGTPGVTFYDVSDPQSIEQLSFYEAADGVHNHDIDGDYAYLTISPSQEANFRRTTFTIRRWLVARG